MYEWSEWDTVTHVDNDTDFIRTGSRTCVDLMEKTEVNSSFCKGKPVFARHYHWGLQFLTWNESREYCSNTVSGILFGGINGSQSQLQFFAQKLNRSSYWLGISNFHDADTFETLDGENVTGIIPWDAEQSLEGLNLNRRVKARTSDNGTITCLLGGGELSYKRFVCNLPFEV